jgi:acyl carrier protein
MPESMDDRITRLLLEHAQNAPLARPLPRELSIRKDLAVESLSLVAVTLALGDELAVDVVESGLELGTIDTVGDLVDVAQRLSVKQSSVDPRKGDMR